MSDYLKDEQHYIDLYDLLTIERCLDIIKFWQKAYKEKSNENEIKNLPKEEKEKGFQRILNIELFATKGQEYQRKKETIAKWVEEGRVKQDKYDNAPEPQNIHCPNCNSLMQTTMKHLEDYMDEPMRVLFFFECPSCKKRRGVYENGEERESKPDLCPQCGKEVKVVYSRKGKVITTKISCTNCKFKKTEVDDLEKSHTEFLKKEEEDRELLKKYRNEFCLTDEKGKEYIETIEAMEVANVVHEEEAQKYDSPIYQRSLQLKKTTISDLEKLLTKVLEKQKYTKLSFDKPEIGQYVIVPFTVQDTDSSRKDRISVSELEKLIKNALEDTNWRLLSNSVFYRLGYLEGRLKGYESEEDMLKLAGKKEEAKPKPKIDEEKRNKYAHHNWVQLARLIGQHEGIENVRKRRLKDEPEGFFLEATEGPYTCSICREQTPGNKIWWNLDSLRCADCWRNTKEGVIPPLKHENEGVWISGSEIKSEYSVQSMTRKKLEREGVLHGRHLKREDGSTYFTVYLIEENKEFFKKYPKKPELDIKLTWSDEHRSLMLDVKKNDKEK